MQIDMDIEQSPFMKACRGEPTSPTPVWFMRQAGRYQASYRAIRESLDFMEMIKRPEVAVEVTVNAVKELGVDAAILFADLLPILEPAGLKLEYIRGTGPVFHNPLRTADDVESLQIDGAAATQQFVYEAIKILRRELPPGLPLIGFAGAPFTLAAYAIEGGSSKHFAEVKRLMLGDEGLWRELMQRLTTLIGDYLQAQIDAGAHALQLFDSWVGALSPEHYRRLVQPWTRQIVQRLAGQVPIIYFGVGTATLLPDMLATGCDVLGVDWHIPLRQAWDQTGARAVQGNLDPVVLFADADVVQREAKAVLDQAQGRPGHIFNLGHGLLPQIPEENVRMLADYVHEQTA